MEIDQIITDISKSIEIFSALAPLQTEFVNFAKQTLESEILRGPRKTFLKRLQSELEIYAKNVLSREKYQLFKSATSSAAVKHEVSETVLQRIIKRGEVSTDAEFSLAMDEVNSLLQGRDGLSEEDQVLVEAANTHLAQYEQRMKDAPLTSKSKISNAS